MHARPLDVCETCMLIVASGSTDGAYSEADEERSVEAMSDRGPFTLGGIDETEPAFSVFECDICGSLPGERFRVYEWDS